MTRIAKHTTLAVKAAVATDEGAFTAIAAAYSVDRAGERIVPGAFRASIERWRESEKQVPLHWDHQADAKSIIGTVDPKAMKETEVGLYVEGHVDLEESEMAKDAWRAMKSGAMSLSFGYLVEESAKAEDGVLELKSLDIFEISVTPAPANSDTKFLELKNVAEMSRDEIGEELKAIADRVAALQYGLGNGNLPAPDFLVNFGTSGNPVPQVTTTSSTTTPPPAEGKGAETARSKASDPEAVRFERIHIEALAASAGADITKE